MSARLIVLPLIVRALKKRKICSCRSPSPSAPLFPHSIQERVGETRLSHDDRRRLTMLSRPTHDYLAMTSRLSQNYLNSSCPVMILSGLSRDSLAMLSRPSDDPLETPSRLSHDSLTILPRFSQDPPTIILRCPHDSLKTAPRFSCDALTIISRSPHEPSQNPVKIFSRLSRDAPTVLTSSLTIPPRTYRDPLTILLR